MWVFALWGLLGGLAVEAMDFVKAIRRVKGWPWRPPLGPGGGPYCVSVIVRIGAGGILAGAAGASGQISGPIIALALGTAAPLVLEKLSQQIPMEDVVPFGIPNGSTSSEEHDPSVENHSDGENIFNRSVADAGSRSTSQEVEHDAT